MQPIRVMAILLLLGISISLTAQNRKYPVSGVVTDSITGQPLANVNITIVGTAGGGITNQNGGFSLTLIRVPSILYFSYLGYGIGSYQVEKSGERNIRIALVPETQEIGEVIISAEKIAKVIRGDTLNIIDYEIDGDRIILLASPYRHQTDLRLYLTTLTGDTLDNMKVKKPGKSIKYPEKMDPQTEFLLRDFTGQVNYLDKGSVHEVRHAFNKLFFGYDTPYPDFIGRVFPNKCEMAGKLVFQVSTPTENFTWYFGQGAINGKLIKTVEDKYGADRYVRSTKCVSAPLFRRGNELFIFDFFNGHFEVFDIDLNPIRKVPINFQYTEVTQALVFRQMDVDVFNFTQTILFDDKTGKAYAFYRMRTGGRQSLREVNLETGKIDRIIEIPDYSNITGIRVYDNAVYFLYDTRIYPFYRLLYRMII